jgi:hypothetical protein
MVQGERNSCSYAIHYPPEWITGYNDETLTNIFWLKNYKKAAI